VAVPGLGPLAHLGGDVSLDGALRSLRSVLGAVVQVASARPHERGGGTPGERDALEHGEVGHDPVGRRHHHHAVLGGRVPGEAADLALAGLHAALDDGGLRLVADGRGRVLHVVQADDVAVARQRGQQAVTGGAPSHLQGGGRNHQKQTFERGSLFVMHVCFVRLVSTHQTRVHTHVDQWIFHDFKPNFHNQI